MKKQCVLLASLALACGIPAGLTPNGHASGFAAMAQSNNGKVTGIVRDVNGEPLIGATIKVKGTSRGTATDVEGRYSINAAPGSTLVISYIGTASQEVNVTGSVMDVTMQSASTNLDEVVVTALGIKKDKKSLGYAIDDLKADELMRNKNTNAINSLAGKIAGVTITQSSGAAGSGAQIILRGGTSLAEDRDNQPLFVVDGVIYDNSTSTVGNSAFDGMSSAATTNSNRVMDINPEDIESMSVLKGPAAAALYGSRAAAGVVIISTKSGKEGAVEVNFNTRLTTSWARALPKVQKTYKRGYFEDQYTDGVYSGTVYRDLKSYSSWGEAFKEGEPVYDNVGDFFQNGAIWDTNLSVAGGTKNSRFFLSGSFFDQDGVVPNTGYKKTTFRFNGEQKYKMFTFGANAAYSQARTARTLTSAGLFLSSGNGALYSLYTWAPSSNMAHYVNEDGTRYRQFGDQLDPWNEVENPYWIINRDKLKDKTERFTGNVNVKADITDWWWVSYRMGTDSYTTDNSNFIAPHSVARVDWQKGMYSENSMRYNYLSTNLISNWNKQFGDFNMNLMLGTSTDDTKYTSNYRMAWMFTVDNFFSFDNATSKYKKFLTKRSRKRLVAAYGEFRVDWRNAIFLTVTGRNDWDSTLPKENRSYFYPSVSGAIAFSELMGSARPDWLTFGKLRASWAKVGKGTVPYQTATSLWPSGVFLDDLVGVGNSWSRGNKDIKPEMTTSTEIGLELRFLQNRLKFDGAWYYNKSVDQILSPRGPQSTGYIFCSMNAGDVTNKGLELSISGTPIQTRDFSWETGINVYGNRGRVKNLPQGLDIMYLTDVQYGNAKAASYGDGLFMAISGSRYARTKDGKIILDPNTMMPTWDGSTSYCIANREPKFQGGWNNTLSYKNFSFNMLWEFRHGGAVFNGTKYAMTMAGTSELSANRERITINGVVKDGDGYKDVSYTINAGDSYTVKIKNKKVERSGANIIKDYYNTYYNYETANWITQVNSLRLRTISLSYDLPKNWLASTHVFKAASLQVSASNLLLFTNYDGDPEVAASGSGVGGSSSAGFDYCGVPSTASFSFGVNLTF